MAPAIPLLIILAAMLSPVLVTLHSGPIIAGGQYVTDVAIALASVFIVARLIATGQWARVPIKYVLVFLGFMYVAVIGIVVNDVTADTAFSGIRAYFKYVPVFLIPFAFAFSDRTIRNQLLVLTLVLLVQIPLVVLQRFVVYTNRTTGDYVTGTLTSTSSQCMVAVCAILIVAALYLDKRIRIGTALALSLAFLTPAALSETKITPILLALGGVGLMYARRNQLGFKAIRQITAAGSALLVLFVVVFNVLYADGRGRTYFQEMTDTAAILDRYNMTGVRGRSFRVAREAQYHIVGARQEYREREDAEMVVGRFDTLRMPFNVLLPHEPLRLIVGLGVGNVDSAFGSGGDYQSIKYELRGTSTGLAALLWETGVLGAALFCTFLVMVAADALRMASVPSLVGTLGVAVFAGSLVFMLGLVYANMFHHAELLVLLSYFGGMVAARLVRARAAERALADLPYVESTYA